ncbi:MAG: topoisomerase C-terminal repeat-containing protein, partial [Bacteroidota bacterium]
DLDRAIQLIQEKRERDRKKTIKTFSEDKDLVILRGRFGPYINYKDGNYPIPKKKEADKLTVEECYELIKNKKEKDKQKKSSGKQTTDSTSSKNKSARKQTTKKQSAGKGSTKKVNTQKKGAQSTKRKNGKQASSSSAKKKGQSGSKGSK